MTRPLGGGAEKTSVVFANYKKINEVYFLSARFGSI